MTLTSYAQNFEDVMLWRALKHVEKGFYIDIGAQDPVIDSVSLAFYERGWNGIHVEPTPHYASLLREKRKGDQVLQAAVSKQKGVMRFFQIPNTGISTGSREIAEQHRQRGFPIEEITVATVSLSDVFEAANTQEVHWLKIDVEGMEGDILKSWRPSKLRPWIVVVESTLPLSQVKSHQSWENVIINLGYRVAYFDGLNRYYVSKDHQELASAFDTPPNVFDDFAVNGTASTAFCSLLNKRHADAIDAAQSRLETVVTAAKIDLDKLQVENLAAVQSLADAKQMLLVKTSQLEAQLLTAIDQRALIEGISVSVEQKLKDEIRDAADSKKIMVAELASKTQKLVIANDELKIRLVKTAHLEVQLADASAILNTVREEANSQQQSIIERERAHADKLDSIREEWRLTEAEQTAIHSRACQLIMNESRQQHEVEISKFDAQIADVRAELNTAREEANSQQQRMNELEHAHTGKLNSMREAWRLTEAEQAAVHSRALNEARQQHEVEISKFDAQLTHVRAELNTAREEANSQQQRIIEREHAHAATLNSMHEAWKQSESEQVAMNAHRYQNESSQVRLQHDVEMGRLDVRLADALDKLNTAREQVNLQQQGMTDRERAHTAKLDSMREAWEQAEVKRTDKLSQHISIIAADISALQATLWWRLGKLFGCLPKTEWCYKPDLLIFLLQHNVMMNMPSTSDATADVKPSEARSMHSHLECCELQEFELFEEKLNKMNALDQLLLSPEREFLIGAYWLILGRRPDVDGMAHYLISLRAGKSRVEVLAILIKSQEAKTVNQPHLEELRELINQTGANATGWRKWLAAPKIMQHQLRMLESQMALLVENLKIVADASQVQADNYCVLADDSTQIGNLPFQEIHASTIETSDLHFSVEKSHIAQPTVGSINLIDFDTNFEPNEKREVIIELKNCSNVVWSTCAEMPIHISYHWFFENGDVCTFDGKRTALSEPVAPGDSKKLRAFVLAPVNYGKYVLEVTLLCEGQYWFEERGFQSCLHHVSIDSPKLCPRAEHIYHDLKTAIANRTR